MTGLEPVARVPALGRGKRTHKDKVPFESKQAQLKMSA